MRDRHSGRKPWYVFAAGALLALQALVFLVFREESYIQVHDNLDLFPAHFEMMKRAGAFFSGSATLPMLHGISRDLFGSEWSLYNIWYAFLPGIVAYFIGCFLKILIGAASFVLLAREVYGERFAAHRGVFLLCGLAFGMIPVFPTYGIAFTSVPLIVWLLVRLYRAKMWKEALPYYAGVFCYPLLSYFSYHGFFILCYMVLAVIILWLRDRRFPKRIFFATGILSVGFMLFEWRLFRAMLFGNTVTIRTTMEHGEVSFGEAMRLAVEEFFVPSVYNTESFHSADTHTLIALPVVLAGLVVCNALHLRRGEKKKILTDPLNGLVLWILLNCLNYGLYQFAPYRTLFETLVPKLTGFEFSRTNFFNAFLWYAALAVVLCRLAASAKGKLRMAPGLVALAAALVVMFFPQVYNDFYHTCYNQAYRILKRQETSTLNYREFYSAAFFERIKEDMGYAGEWSAAYGMHPAVLQYNGIATVDGYLGMYSVEYREQWGRVIAPAMASSPWLKAYFEGWGARAYLYSGSDENTYAPLRVMALQDERLSADAAALKELDCRYIFSRVRFSNETEAGLSLKEVYEDEQGPYVIYVYEIAE